MSLAKGSASARPGHRGLRDGDPDACEGHFLAALAAAVGDAAQPRGVRRPEHHVAVVRGVQQLVGVVGVDERVHIDVGVVQQLRRGGIQAVAQVAISGALAVVDEVAEISALPLTSLDLLLHTLVPLFFTGFATVLPACLGEGVPNVMCLGLLARIYRRPSCSPPGPDPTEPCPTSPSGPTRSQSKPVPSTCHMPYISEYH